MSGFKSLYQPYLYMERMLSECVPFQELIGVDSAEEAKQRIKFIAVQDFDKANNSYQAVPMPRVAIWNLNASKTRTSAGTYATQPRLVISLEIEIPSEIGPTEDEQFRYCGPLYEAIEDGLATMSRTPGNLDFGSISYLTTPGPMDPKENQGRRIWGADIEFVCRG